MTETEFARAIKPGMMFNGPFGGGWNNLFVLKMEEVKPGLINLKILYQRKIFLWAIQSNNQDSFHNYTILTRKEKQQP